jgi:hypothetical protein
MAPEQEESMTDGLVLLTAWPVFLASVAALLWAVLQGTRR